MKVRVVYLLIPLVVLVLAACVKDQDFGQYDDLQVRPTYEASIIYLQTTQQYMDGVASDTLVSQTYDFGGFSDDLVTERLLEGVMVYELTNMTNRPVTLALDYIDAGGNVLDTQTFLMSAAPTAVQYLEVAYGGSGRNINIIRNTAAIRMSAVLGSATTTGDSQAQFTFKTAARFKIEIK